MYLRIYTSLKHLTIPQVKRLSKVIVIWCIDHLGENKRIHKPLFLELNADTTDSDTLAEYEIEEDKRTIRIFLHSIKTIKDLISCIIHENIHDIQPTTTKYDKLYKKYGYANHPHEKHARKMEDKFTRICWDDIRPKVQKILDAKR